MTQALYAHMNNKTIKKKISDNLKRLTSKSCNPEVFLKIRTRYMVSFTTERNVNKQRCRIKL
jgi:hypothetical protein